jgi:formylglycine-generating enzyme required for sulfatase activity
MKQRRAILLLVLAACRRSPSEPALRESAEATTDATSPALDAGMSNAGAAAPASVEPPGPMVLIKGGRFRMGSDYFVNFPDEQPAHIVTVPSFLLDATQVTVAAYRACVNATACPMPATQDNDGPSVWTFPDVDRHPMTGVTWKEAHDYCAWAGKELPTEEQWEYACAGPAGRAFPWGSYFPEDAMVRVSIPCGGSRAWGGTSCPVGLHPAGATPQGIQDLMGKTGEWTGSLYCPYDHRDCAGPKRAVRGGGRAMEEMRTRCARRSASEPTYLGNTLGFRCAQSVPDAGGAR